MPCWFIVCGTLLTVLLLIHTTSLRHKGLTTDEPLHYQYGYRVLNGSPGRTGALNSSTMPFSTLHAMTSGNIGVFARITGISTDTSWDGQVKHGRYATIALSLLLALYVFKWSYELYGRNGALLSLSLYVFDPNLLAHGQLVTADLPAALMTTSALYHFWHFLELGGKRRAFFSALTLGPYVQGLDLVKFEERMGQAWGNIYMAGQLRVNHHDGTLHGFPGYYFYAAFFKVPIGTQIIFLVALFGYFSRRAQPAARGLRRQEIFLLVPILLYWVYFNFFFNAQIGIRHVLPVFALATVFCGRFLAAPESKLRRYAAVVLVGWVAASALSYYPHFISYFNEFVPDRKLAYRHLADSNLDWRGNEWYLKEYIHRHPGVIVDPRKPQAGRIVVPVNALVGVNRNPQEYKWLRENFTPVDHIAYSYLVYDVPKRMLRSKDSRVSKEGSPDPRR